MIIELFLRANRERVIITVPQADLNLDMKNVIAFKPAKGSLNSRVVVGCDAEDLQKGVSEEWEKLPTRIRFAHPFDIDQFEPDMAVSFLDYGSLLAIASRVQSSKLDRFMIRFVNRYQFDVKLEIEGYEILPLTMQQEFENHLRHVSLTRISRLSINGHDIRKNNWQWILAESAMRWTGITLGYLLAAVGLIYVPRLTTGLLHYPLQGRDILIAQIDNMVRLVISAYVGFKGGPILALLVLRQFLPRTMLKTLIKLDTMGLPKPIIRWLTDKVLSEAP